ncbi:hypothetical protein LX24_02082 [Desulfallas thermosapovorans DSM 6562]|uniref:Uncharacterized protein n=1 Tax=Desulfallas thermosapovorans DSM 6562 TaxID=1121431 RepID=A0A5S4ZPX4_9FIRM|nr:hypothetical protein LX24_02082 [Desulfallas thermosapovorans DSM 6562]
MDHAVRKEVYDAEGEKVSGSSKTGEPLTSYRGFNPLCFAGLSKSPRVFFRTYLIIESGINADNTIS